MILSLVAFSPIFVSKVAKDLSVDWVDQFQRRCTVQKLKTHIFQRTVLIDSETDL